MKRLEVPAYPFLAAVYFVLALAAANAGELVRSADLVRPLVLATGFAGVAWVASRVATRDVHRRAIVTFVAVIIFATYGHWRTFFEAMPPLATLGGGQILLPVSALAVGFTAWAAGRPGSGRPGLTRYLNLAAALLVVITLAGLAWNGIRPEPEVRFEPGAGVTGAAMTDRPHVFVVVLDKYTGSRSLRAQYGYDNGPFERFLEGRGFYVARTARANYVHTFLALAAMLNWEYLDWVAARVGPEEARWHLTYPLIEDNRTVRAVKAAGYRFVFMPTGFAATASNRLADVQLPDPRHLTREFEAVWLRTTALDPLMAFWCARASCAQGFMLYASEAARSIDWKFEQLGRLATAEAPLFVLAHLTTPHEPYVYTADCTHAVPYWPVRDDGPEAARVKQAYVAQVECLNKKLERLVVDLQQSSTRPIVIALQSDHGHGRFGPKVPRLADAPASNVAERLDIFAAYYLPGAPKELMSDSIGPVNAMRAILRHYLGLAVPPLPEASYWSSDQRPYQFTRLR